MLPVFVLLEKNTAHAQKIKRHQYYRYPSMHSAPTDLKRQEKPDMLSLQTDHSKEALACDNHTPPPGRKSPQYRSYENEETVLKSASQELSFRRRCLKNDIMKNSFPNRQIIHHNKRTSI